MPWFFSCSNEFRDYYKKFLVSALFSKYSNYDLKKI